MTLVLHPITEHRSRQVTAHPAHSLLIEATDGTGKGAVASYLAAKILDIGEHKVLSSPFVRHIAPDTTISIDAIRELNSFVKLKIPGAAAIRRIIIVEHAQRMTIEAQNAFLKLLEEPPADTVIILTASNSKQLLPTITSRLAVIRLAKPTEESLKNFFLAQGFEQKEIDKAYAMSRGTPGVMTAILDHAEDEPLLLHISYAKDILRATTFERLSKVDEIIKRIEKKN